MLLVESKKVKKWKGMTGVGNIFKNRENFFS
jgi:hypothetical protein